MAPISNAVMGIDDDQRFALMKFRRSVRDIMKPEHDDHFLLRWLRARKWDPEAAEKMLRDSMQWREKWGIDTALHDWQPPETLQKYFPSGTTGFDKDGSPVIIVPFAGFDVWGLLHSVTRTEIIKLVMKTLEYYLALSRKQAEKHGPAALKLTVLFDMDNFNMRHYVRKPAAEMVITLIQIYEANYPEILKTCIIFNAPKVFSLAFSIVKKFMDDYTLSKINIMGTDSKKWKAQILTIVDPDQLPEYYGGNLVEDGDPKCSSKVKQGGKVPKNLYTRNSDPDSDKNYTRVTVKTGEKHNVDLLCADEGSVLRWECGVDSHDIKFLVKCRDEDGNETVVFGPKKVPEGTLETGVLSVSGPATYSLIFDNSSAYLRSKKLFYNALIANPAKDLNIIDTPDAEETATGCSAD